MFVLFWKIFFENFEYKHELFVTCLTLSNSSETIMWFRVLPKKPNSSEFNLNLIKLNLTKTRNHIIVMWYRVFTEKTEKVRNSKKMVRYSRILPNFFRGFGNVNFPNFPKPSKKWRTIRTSEIRKYSFRLGNRPESSAKSSECRALISVLKSQNCSNEILQRI